MNPLSGGVWTTICWPMNLPPNRNEKLSPLANSVTHKIKIAARNTGMDLDLMSWQWSDFECDNPTSRFERNHSLIVMRISGCQATQEVK